MGHKNFYIASTKSLQTKLIQIMVLLTLLVSMLVLSKISAHVSFSGKSLSVYSMAGFCSQM